MLTLDDARRRVVAEVLPLARVTRPVAEVLGLRAAGPIVADVDLPPGPVSAMDGYAARAADLRADHPLPVTHEIQAGARPVPLPLGEAARIFTGALLPPGADCVVPQERAERTEADGRILVRLAPADAGACVRAAGEVFRRGDVLVMPGTRLDPTHVALIAAGASAAVPVHPRPRVAILTTGTELVTAGATPAPGQIRDSNTPMLAALAREAGLAVVHAGHARDERSVLIRELERALDAADLVVTSGGVSVGDYDLVPHALAALDGTTIVHGVAMRPGKPVLVAHARGAMLLGLPGNPVSALVGWRLFGRPIAEAMAGDERAFEERLTTARAGTAVENPGTRLLLLPTRRQVSENGPVLIPVIWRGSHDVRGVAGSRALARVEPGTSVPSGGSIGCYPLPWHGEDYEEIGA